MAPSCIFCDIVAGKVHTKKVFEDKASLVFHDRAPAAPVHVLVIPKKHIAGLSSFTDAAADEAVLGRLLGLARHVAKELGLEQAGYRIVINNGVDAGQTVPHLHLHVLGGRPLGWPPG